MSCFFFLIYLFREEAANSGTSNTSNTGSTSNTSRRGEPFYLWTSLPNPLDSDNARTQRESERSSTTSIRSSSASAAAAGSAEGQAAAVAARVASTAAARVASSAAAMMEAAETQAADDDSATPSSSSASANTTLAGASNASQSSTNQSFRPVCRARYSRLPPSSSGPNQPSSFQFYRRRGNPPWASRIHDEMFEPSPNRVQSAEPDSVAAEQTPSSTSRCTPRQPANQTDAPEARSPMSIRRQRWAVREAGRASIRRIEARRSNQDIIPPGAAHVAHIGRIPDTPPSTETGDASSGGSSSAVETGGDTEMVTETAESSRPMLLRAAPCPNVPPVASSSAGMCKGQGNFKKESVVAAILLSRVEESYIVLLDFFFFCNLTFQASVS